MKKNIIILLLVVIGIGAVPYIVSLTSYRGGAGYACDGFGFSYVDKTHYDAFQIAYYDLSIQNRVTFVKGVFYFDGEPIKTDERSFFINSDGTIQPIIFEIDDYRTTDVFSSDIVGLFGPVPHFKDYAIDAPTASIASKLPPQ